MLRNREESIPSLITESFVIVTAQNNCFLGEVVKIMRSNGEVVYGEVIEVVSDEKVVVFCSEQLLGLGKDDNIQFLGHEAKVPLSPLFTGEALDLSKPNYGLDIPIAEYAPLRRIGVSPMVRVPLDRYLRTGNPAVDFFTPLAFGQKIAVFASPSVSANSFFRGLFRSVPENCLIMGGLMGVSKESFLEFETGLKQLGVPYILPHTYISASPANIVNTPFVTLRIAEYFASQMGKDVIIFLTDMSVYANALRELSLMRMEMPGRKNYPTNLFSDFASIYEKAGRFTKMRGSITVIGYNTVPGEEDDHPIVDTTGYITEGQIVLSREAAEVYPKFPFEIQGSLSRLSSEVVHESFPQHLATMNFFFQTYMRAKELMNVVHIIGEDMLNEEQRALILFKRFVDLNFIATELKCSSFDIQQLVQQGLQILPHYMIPGNLVG